MAHISTTLGRGGRSSITGSKAVVFGAYGFVGRYIVNRLARQGTQVVVPYRCDPHDIRHLRPTGDLGVIRPVYCDPRNDQDLDLVTRGADVVYNLIGQDKATWNWTLEDANADLAGRIAGVAKQNEVGRFVHMSAVGASKDAPSDYYKTKAMGEEIVREKFPEATIMRSSVIFGPEDRLSNRIAVTYQRLPKWLPLPIPNGGRDMRAPVYVGDVAAALLEVMSNKNAPGETYELFGPDHLSSREFIQEVSEVIMREHTVGYVPLEALRAVGPLIHPVAEIVLKSSILHKDIIEQQTIDEIPSGLPGFDELGVTATPFRAVGLRWLRRFRPPHFSAHVLADDDYKEQRLV